MDYVRECKCNGRVQSIPKTEYDFAVKCLYKFF